MTYHIKSAGVNALFDRRRDEQFCQEQNHAIAAWHLTGSPLFAQAKALDTWRGLITALGTREQTAISCSRLRGDFQKRPKK